MPKEVRPGEARVAIVPETVKRLATKGIKLLVESGAGEGACFPDDEYTEAGATVESSMESLLGAADVVVKVQAPTLEEIEKTQEGAALISLLYPLLNIDVVG
ncbi:MAG: NAD(P)(+) transhydrogenase (Re/Si-specific) subunit alpha, partial [Candidatus Methylomirabilaceae bacterium]